MENGKKIGIWVLVVILGLSGWYLISREKKANYGYELTSVTGSLASTGTTVTTSGTIATPGAEWLAYLSSFDGIIEKEVGSEKKAIETGTRFQEGDSIITGKDSTAEVIFSDNSLVRMNANSRLTLVKLSNEGSEVNLKEGDIWARVLKPLYDTSFFTISTSDVSAGVQGTSVRMRKMGTGTTDVAVIDSYSPTPEKAGVILRYNNPKRKVWSETILKPETQFTYTASGRTTKTESLSGTIAFSDPFIRENTKRDILYIDNLSKKITDNKNLLQRLQWELEVSVPRQEEIPVFFNEPPLKKIIINSWGPGGAPLSEKTKESEHVFMMESIEQDLSISKTEESVRKMKKNLELSTTTNEEKKKIEDTLKLNEEKVSTLRKEIREKINIQDSDADGIPDIEDNCPRVGNADQKDANANNIGDACETLLKTEIMGSGTLKTETKSGTITPPPTLTPKPIIAPEKTPLPIAPVIKDSDKDGIPDDLDNCPLILNPGQKDTYGDKRGDACEPLPITSGEAIIE